MKMCMNESETVETHVVKIEFSLFHITSSVFIIWMSWNSHFLGHISPDLSKVNFLYFVAKRFCDYQSDQTSRWFCFLVLYLWNLQSNFIYCYFALQWKWLEWTEMLSLPSAYRVDWTGEFSANYLFKIGNSKVIDLQQHTLLFALSTYNLWRLFGIAYIFWILFIPFTHLQNKFEWTQLFLLGYNRCTWTCTISIRMLSCECKDVQKYYCTVGEDVEFVHLFKSNGSDNLFVSCQSGLCQHSFGKKRSVKKLNENG